MYKAFQNKKYYLAFHRFPKTAKKPPYNYAYLTGYRKWVSGIKSINITYLNRGTNARAEIEIIAFTREQYDMINYAIVIGTFRIMFGIKTPNYTCDAEVMSHQTTDDVARMISELVKL